MPIDDATWSELEIAAREASESAYCPYSRFRVGAAVLTDDGLIVRGCNVENASYGLTICAERNAIFQAVAAGKRVVIAIVVFTPTDRPTAPCGACRQVIFEFGGATIVRSICLGRERFEAPIRALLPEAFGPSNLEGSSQ